jgi:5-formyltetrahydrofolate cyclo-ligase
MTKKELRSIYLKKRREMTAAELRDKSERISSLFFHQVDLSDIKFLHVFIPILKNNEPDTWIIINKVRSDFPKTRIVLPRVEYSSMKMENYIYQSEEDLELNSWGIKEPRRTEKIDPAKIDLVLVPLLIFDLKGNRVGYGKGFYDKFLAECRVDCERIGLSLFEAIDQISDIDSQDEPLHQCITPNMLMRF